MLNYLAPPLYIENLWMGAIGGLAASILYELKGVNIF